MLHAETAKNITEAVIKNKTNYFKMIEDSIREAIDHGYFGTTVCIPSTDKKDITIICDVLKYCGYKFSKVTNLEHTDTVFTIRWRDIE